MLITFGDSYTWGQGLDSHLMKEMFPDWSKKLMETAHSGYQPNEYQLQKWKITNAISELNICRLESTYGYLLNQKLGTTHITNRKNGGTNIDRFTDLKFFNSLFDISTDTHLTHCVFQLTHPCGDIKHILDDRDGSWKLDEVGMNIINTIFPIEYRNMITERNWSQKEIMGLFDTSMRYVVNYISNEFKIMEEKWGTKCIFFMSHAEMEYTPSFWEFLRSNPYFVPMIWNGVEYTTFLEMGRINDLTINKTTGIYDDHCDNSLHKWLAEYLYTKLI